MSKKPRYSIIINTGINKILQANHVELLVPKKLEDLISPLQEGLSKNFEDVEVKIVQCPDLTKWCGLAEHGLCGATRLVDVGGVPYMMDPTYHNITYQMPDILNACGVQNALVIGAGAASPMVIGKNAELMANSRIPGPRYSMYAKIGTQDIASIEETNEEDENFDDGEDDDNNNANTKKERKSSKNDDELIDPNSENLYDIVPIPNNTSLKQIQSLHQNSKSDSMHLSSTSPIVQETQHNKSPKLKSQSPISSPQVSQQKETFPSINLDENKASTTNNTNENKNENPDETLKEVPIVGHYPSDETGCLANLFLSEGKRDNVIYIKVKKRTGVLNFTNCIRESLKNYKECLDSPDKQIGLGGVFKINEGKVKAHIMPDFCTHALKEGSKEIDEWLRYFEFGPNLLMLSCLITDDPTPDKRLHLRLEHTHFYTMDKHKHEGGHYHCDTTPDIIEYEGYFSLAQYIYRVEDAYYNINK